jgi:hypothetical protein
MLCACGRQLCSLNRAHFCQLHRLFFVVSCSGRLLAGAQTPISRGGRPAFVCLVVWQAARDCFCFQRWRRPSAFGLSATRIDLQLASNCMALDQRLKRILEGVGATVGDSVDKHYEEIERELIEKVAKPSGLSGGELDRMLIQNYGDIPVRLLCP